MSRSRTIFADGEVAMRIEDGVCVYVRPGYGERKESELACPMVVRDIEPYRNMIDGRMITSRAEHRELLKRHGKVEIGNEIAAAMRAPEKPQSQERRKLLHKQLADVSDRQANKIIKQLKKAHSP